MNVASKPAANIEIHAPARANRLAFPFDQRALVAGWKLLFLRHGSYQADAAKPAA